MAAHIKSFFGSHSLAADNPVRHISLFIRLFFAAVAVTLYNLVILYAS